MEPLKQTTESEIQDERLFNKEVLSFLQAKLDSMSRSEIQALHETTMKCLNEAALYLCRKLKRMPNLNIEESSEALGVKVRYHETADALAGCNMSSIVWGAADPSSNTLSILNVLILAPKEIVRLVFTHELLHIVYGLIDPTHLAKFVEVSEAVKEYPEASQQEEMWVRNMMEKLDFTEGFLEKWEAAVEMSGDNWQPTYYLLKKR